MLQFFRATPLKQCATDPIPTWLLKDCSDFLAPCITWIVNSSLATGYVPKALKQAYITPLLKKTGLDVNMAANYRPVSYLSGLLKLLERVVNQQIEEHLSRDGHFRSHQSA